MILIVTAVFPPEPVVSAILAGDLANVLSKKADVMVFSPPPSRPMGFKFDMNQSAGQNYSHTICDSYTCPKSKLFGRFRESYSFGKYAANYIHDNSFKIDCVYILVWPIFAPWLILRMARKHGIKTVFHVQDLYPESLSNKFPLLIGAFINAILRPFDRFCLKVASRIVVISDKMQDVIIHSRKIDRQKIEVIHNWHDTEEFLSYAQISSNQKSKSRHRQKFSFMFLGNIGPVAGVELLIEAFSYAKLKDATLIIAGSGSRKAQCIKKAKIHDEADIRFLDVPQGKVAELQAQASVMLLPLISGAASSSVPSKLPAYMFSAKPVLACVDLDSYTARVLERANCGWVIPPGDSELLGHEMKKIGSFPMEYLESLGKNGKAFAMRHFTKEINLKKLVDLVQQTAMGEISIREE